MRHFILSFTCIFTFISPTLAQTIWSETFDTPGLGVWGTEGTSPETAYPEHWVINYEECTFSDAADYAKTVTTGGGRFEAIDSDGELIFISRVFDISEYFGVAISLDAVETGSAEDISKKYIHASFVLNYSDTITFDEGQVGGNWGSSILSHNNISGDSLQLLIKMNSSYANDKVYIDNILIEGFDSTTNLVDKIILLESPLYAFEQEPFWIRASGINASGDPIKDSTAQLVFESEFIEAAPPETDEGTYAWQITAGESGNLHYSIQAGNSTDVRVDSTVYFFKQSEKVVYEAFDEIPDQSWTIGANWHLDNSAPLSGNYSLRSKRQETGGSATLSYQGEQLKFGQDDYLIALKIKNGDWDPSGLNHFFVSLKSSDSEQADGYAIGVNAKGLSDLVSIWKITKGEIDYLIGETSYDWDESVEAQLTIHRTVTGNWILSVVDLETGKKTKDEFSHNEISQINVVEFQFNCTKSYSDLLWIDDILIAKQNAAPIIHDVRVVEAQVLEIEFNEALDQSSISETDFSIRAESIDIGIESMTLVDDKHVRLRTEAISYPYLLVLAEGISDPEGLLQEHTEFLLEYALPAEANMLAITEIMADPNPSAGLPETEYIELYNRSDQFIQLEGWKLFVRNSNWDFPNYLLYPNSYLVLCHDDFADAFNNVDVLAFDRFPNLLNSGTTLRLISNNGNTIDEVIYSEDWYKDDEKKHGGYSLEKIDLNRFCGNANNWMASSNENGGTPGRQNAVFNHNPDNAAPQLEAVNVVSSDSLILLFSEAIDSLSAISFANYSTPELSLQDIEYSSGQKQVLLIFAAEFEAKKIYTLFVKNIEDECGNVLERQERTFVFSILVPGDLVINEVLFNPYPTASDFIEIYNKSGAPVDAASLNVATRNDRGELQAIKAVSLKHKRINDKTLLAFTEDTLSLFQNYMVKAPENILQSEALPALNNSMATLVLLNDALDVLDEFTYSAAMHSDWLSDQSGVSLERLSIDAPTNDPDNWLSASSIAGYATPGYKNSQQPMEDVEQTDITLESDVVSPNGDGYNDQLTITFSIDESGYMANVYIFNAYGIEVKRLLNNQIVGNENTIKFNLRKENGELLPMGTYVIFAELINLNTERKVIKKAFHVTDNLR